jgi:hypothetical protein
MITAKNYAAQVCFDLGKIVKMFEGATHAEVDHTNFKTAINKINKAIHFVVPDGGRILNGGLRGIRNTKLKLPYDSITIEYYFQQSVNNRKDPTSCVNKRLIIADQHEDFIRICCVFYVPHNNSWTLWPIFIDIDEKWDDTDGVEILQLRKDVCDITDSNLPAIRQRAVGVLLPASFKAVENQSISRQNAIDRLCFYIREEVVVVLELVEALSCKNVSEEIYQKQICKTKNKKRKIVFHETKMLVINASSGEAKNYRPGNSTHASPRQHLRRGHIRRLPSGNYWVNSCVVGDPTKGTIDKQYAVV